MANVVTMPLFGRTGNEASKSPERKGLVVHQGTFATTHKLNDANPQVRPGSVVAVAQFGRAEDKRINAVN
jgi:hypothetical protein